MRARSLTTSVCAAALLGGCAATGAKAASTGPGAAALASAFDPRRYFAEEPKSGDGEIVLTIAASARDDYAPDYSLAVAYRCLPLPDETACQGAYGARMLRVTPGDEAFGISLGLARRAREARSAEEVREALGAARLSWLEADLHRCEGALAAMEAVRTSDWRPDVHYALLPTEDREIILHPAQIRVTMTGAYTTTTYVGWRLANGVPAAAEKLAKALEPCWKPSKARRPWR